MTLSDANEFLSQTGSLPAGSLDEISRLPAPPAGFERIWGAFSPMEVMQKHGQLFRPQTGEAWQLLCDEGKAMGATDWAPPPLAYFGAGLASSIAGAIAEKASGLGIAAESITVSLDNIYRLKGSILRGTMQGTGLDPLLEVAIDGSSLSPKDKSSLVMDALAGTLAGYVLKQVFKSEFSLTLNGEPVALDLDDWAQDLAADVLPTAALAGSAVVAKTGQRPADANFDTSGGFGHDTVQDRTFAVSAVARSAGDGVFAVEAGIARPELGVFRIMGSPDAGAQGAPSSGILIAAGIGFCYMTQLGRYAEAQKRPVEDYRMIQAIDVPLPGSDGSQTPGIGTKVFLNLPEADADYAREVVHSGRRTCFLHSTLQDRLRTKVSVAEEAASAPAA